MAASLSTKARFWCPLCHLEATQTKLCRAPLIIFKTSAVVGACCPPSQVGRGCSLGVAQREKRKAKRWFFSSSHFQNDNFSWSSLQFRRLVCLSNDSEDKGQAWQSEFNPRESPLLRTALHVQVLILSTLIQVKDRWTSSQKKTGYSYKLVWASSQWKNQKRPFLVRSVCHRPCSWTDTNYNIFVGARRIWSAYYIQAKLTSFSL